MLSLSNALRSIYTTHWSYNNNFHVAIHWVNSDFSTFLGWNKNYDIHLNVVGVTTPQFQTDQIEHFIADRWILEDGIPQLHRFTLTIRDQDALKYYRTFLLAKSAQQKLYFDDYKFVTAFYKDPDYADEEPFQIFNFENCKIESVGGIAFSNENEAQIAQFDLEIQSALPSFNSAGIE